jgi:hypothetical protein
MYNSQGTHKTCLNNIKSVHKNNVETDEGLSPGKEFKQTEIQAGHRVQHKQMH